MGKSKPASRWVGYGMAISGGVLWAIGGSCGQELFRTNTITTGWLVPIRLVIAGVLFLMIAKCSGHAILPVWKQPKAWGRLLGYAVCGVAASQYSFYGCIEYANVAFSTVMCYICSIFILLYTMLRDRRRPKLYEITAVICVVVGVFACATHFDITCLSVSPLALGLGLLCGITAAVNTLLPLPLMDRFGLLPVMGWGMLLGGGVMSLLFRPWTVEPIVNTQLIVFMAIIILGGTIVAFAFYMRGIQLVGAVAGNVLSAVEPVAAVIISVLILNVDFTAADFVGFILILLTIPIIALGQTRERKADSISTT